MDHLNEPDLFYKKLIEEFPGYLVSGGRELYHVYPRGEIKKPPSKDAIVKIARDELGGLEFTFFEAVRDGTGIGKEDVVFVFRKTEHFISVGTVEQYACINILWRGTRVENERERQKYVHFIKKYFETTL